MVVCDFFAAAFRTLYVFVVMEIGSRQILHYNVTAYPTGKGHCSSAGKQPIP